MHRGFLNPAFFSRECVAAQLRRAIDETRAMLGDDGSAGGPEQDTEAAMAAARLITPQGAGSSSPRPRPIAANPVPGHL